MIKKGRPALMTLDPDLDDYLLQEPRPRQFAGDGPEPILAERLQSRLAEGAAAGTLG